MNGGIRAVYVHALKAGISDPRVFGGGQEAFAHNWLAGQVFFAQRGVGRVLERPQVAGEVEEVAVDGVQPFVEPEAFVFEPADVLNGRHSDVGRAGLQHSGALLRFVSLHEYEVVEGGVGAPVVDARFGFDALCRQPFVYYEGAGAVRHAECVAQFVEERLGLHPNSVLAYGRRVLQSVGTECAVFGNRDIFAFRSPRLVILIRLGRVGVRRVGVFGAGIVERPGDVFGGQRADANKFAAV